MFHGDSMPEAKLLAIRRPEKITVATRLVSRFWLADEQDGLFTQLSLLAVPKSSPQPF
jgi:hypothetical protein